MSRNFPKLWVFFFCIVAVLVMAILATGSFSPTTTQIKTDAPEPTRYATFEKMLAHGDNAIYVENQTAGSTFVLVGFAVLSQSGFVVIYNDNDGVPGFVIGESDLLESGGEHLVLLLDEPLADEQVYYALLYYDNGDGQFGEDKDVQVVDSEQSVILMTFIATSRAEPESDPVVP